MNHDKLTIDCMTSIKFFLKKNCGYLKNLNNFLNKKSLVELNDDESI